MSLLLFREKLSPRPASFSGEAENPCLRGSHSAGIILLQIIMPCQVEKPMNTIQSQFRGDIVPELRST